MRIFEDEHIYAIWIDGPSDHVVISFSNTVTVPDGVRCYGDTPSRKTGTACLGVVSKQQDWFCPSDSVRALALSAARRLAKYQTRVAYGSSMGGYAALKFSRLFNATHILALAPQWSIDPVEAGRDPGWSWCVNPAMRGMGVRYEDMCGAAYLFVDPRDELDSWHATQIRSVYPMARTVPVYGSGHHVGTVLATTEFFRAALAGALADDVASMASVANRVRRRSGFKVDAISDRAFSRHPEWVLRILAKTAEIDPPQIHNVRRYFFPAFAGCIARIGAHRAMFLAQRFEPHFAGSNMELDFRAAITR
jgi:hypothetical protein